MFGFFKKKKDSTQKAVEKTHTIPPREGLFAEVWTLLESDSAPDFFEKHGKDSPKLQNELELLRNEQAALYERWEFLEQKKERCKK